jgi:MoxR-like ATPase
MQGRTFVLPDDVKAVCVAVMRHRLTLSTDAELDGLEVVGVLQGLLDSVPILGADKGGAAA